MSTVEQGIGAAERATKLVNDGPYQVVAAVFGVAFILTLLLLLWEMKRRGAIDVQLAVAVQSLGDIMAQVELLPPKKRVTRRPTNPGRRPPETT